jgi:hypothetical protein
MSFAAPGSALTRITQPLAAVPTFRTENREHVEKFVQHMARFVGTEQFILRVGQSLIKRSAEVGLLVDGVAKSSGLSAAEVIDSPLQSVHIDKRDSFSLQLMDALALCGAVSEFNVLHRQAFNKMTSKGMSHQEAVKTLNEPEVKQQLTKMAERKEALQKEALEISEKFTVAKAEAAAKLQASVAHDELLDDHDPRSLTYQIIQRQEEQAIEEFAQKVDAKQIQERAEIAAFKAQYGAQIAEPLQAVSEWTAFDAFMSFAYEHGLYAPAVHRVIAKVFGDVHVDVTTGDVASASFFMMGGKMLGAASKAVKPLAKVVEPILAKSMRGMERLAQRYGARVTDKLPGLFKNPDVMTRGMMYENHVAKKLPQEWRLQPNHPTFDFYDPKTLKAVSVKSLDTQTAARLADPTQIYKSIRQNVNKAVNYTGGEYTQFTKDQILSRELHIGIPVQTNKMQWQEIQKAIQYGKEKGVNVIIEAVK